MTSPADNSVKVLGLSYVSVSRAGGTVMGTVRTGAQPHAVACPDRGPLGGVGGLGIVSNVGDNTLTVFDPDTRTVRATIPGVPGSRGFHGIAVSSSGTGSLVAWVAGSDANVVTVVDLVNSRVLTQLPVPRPTAVIASNRRDGSVVMYVASAGSNSITGYDRDSLRPVEFQAVPDPQDFVLSPLGIFVISGQNSLWRYDPGSLPGAATLVANIPGATALASEVERQRVAVTSATANSVYVVQPAPPPAREFSVANGASFATAALAPGSLASALAATGVSQNLSVFSPPLPVTLGGVMLNIGGSLTFDTANNRWVYSPAGSIPAPLLFVGPNQINFQIPPEIVPGIPPGAVVPAQLTKADGTTLVTTMNIVERAPGIFTMTQDGRFQAAVLNEDSSQNGIPELIAGARPAARGSVIQIFATGGGATEPPLPAGEAAPASGEPLVRTRQLPSVLIGGHSARVLFSGMAPGLVGVWQINAEVPAQVAPGSAVRLAINPGSIVASNDTTIAVE